MIWYDIVGKQVENVSIFEGADNRTFETLKYVFEGVEKECGINVEIKYPQQRQVHWQLITWLQQCSYNSESCCCNLWSTVLHILIKPNKFYCDNNIVREKCEYIAKIYKLRIKIIQVESKISSFQLVHICSIIAAKTYELKKFTESNFLWFTELFCIIIMRNTQFLSDF